MALHVHEHVPDVPTDAPLVVLVHGSMDRAASFAKTMGHLRDLHVIRYDRRGYGKSLDAGPPASVAEHADDLLGLIGDRRAVVVGHSLGGDIALAAAARRSSPIVAVGAYEAPMSWTSWWPKRNAGGMAMLGAGEGGPEAAAEAFLRRMIGDQRWEQLPAATRAARRAEGHALVAELASLREEPPYSLDDITVPVLAGTGTESSDHHVRASHLLADSAGVAPVTVIEGASHGAHRTHPAEFAAFVRAVVAAAG